MAIGNICIHLLENTKKEKTKIKLATNDNKPISEQPGDSPIPSPKIEEIKADFNPNEGVDNLNVAIVAPNAIQAKDYLCGIYYDFINLTQGSPLSVYTRHHESIKMLTETKQYLERVVSNRTGTKIDFGSDSAVLPVYTLILGLAARQKHSLNLHFRCLGYDSASQATSSDIVLVIVNSADSGITGEVISGISSSMGSKSVTWVITGFVRENPFFALELDSFPNFSVTGQLKNKYGIPCKNGDSVSYAQQYGGLVIEETKGSVPVYTTNSKCREYTPVACSLPLAYALESFKTTCDANRVTLHQICNILNTHLTSELKVDPSWYEKSKKTEGDI